MRVLAIGNSFAVDANRYLHQVAKADGEKLEIVTLFISGCTLEMHYENMLSGERVYQLHYNGSNTGFYVSMEEALRSRDWDVVTMQQSSGNSTNPDSYEPYASALASYVKQFAPTAQLVIHQTWAYEKDSDRLHNLAGYDTPAEMFADIEKAYQQMRERVGAVGIIPSGQMFMALLNRGIENLHRDTFHATKGIGRYALGLLWYRMLTGKEVTGNRFCDFDEPVSDNAVSIVKAYVDTLQPIFETIF